MAYVPNHVADVFISYCHEDDFVFIERFEQDLNNALIRKLRARTKPAIFFDAHDLRAGRVFDNDIAACLAQTGFFVAMVSPRYNSSDYCRQKELTAFLRHQPPESGRLIQVQLDLSAPLPVDKALAVPCAGSKGIFSPDTEEYKDALRRVYEPIISELDKLYANSKMIFLAFPGEHQLEEERNGLKSEIEGRGLRIFPEAVAEYESDVRLRDALEQCTTSVHFFGRNPEPFDVRQWDMAVQLNRPCILASQSPTETRRGPADSPAPIYLDQGNPTIALAKAIEQIAGIGGRNARDVQLSLGRTPVFLAFNTDSDATLGLKIRKHISSQGPFEVIIPPSDSNTRYQDLTRAKAALLCRAKAGRDWIAREVEALSRAMVASQVFDLRRALLLPAADDVAGLDIMEDDTILHSDADLEAFLNKLQGAAS
ncbi:MAG TPA: toll/interleukin-1 receptor domain-containing protein [Candidatus Angelobacter sp.]|nr:toll/interleukin-1 receptor domain-containing protein [Candidatus Angelobacter sp.]